MGNEYTVRCSSHGAIVYRGSSQSNYNYYRNQSRQCPRCHEEDAARARETARQRAREAAAREERRVRERQAQLEAAERQRQRRREEERAREREAERQRIIAERQRQEEERQRLAAEALARSTEEMKQQAERLKSLNSSPQNPFLHYKRLNTRETVQEIADRVEAFAYVGQVVTQRVTEISYDLERALDDDYQLIQEDVERYKKYGKQMTSMTDAFKTEFNKVFDKDIKDAKPKEIIEMLNDSADPANDDDEKKDLQEEVKENLQKISNAMNNLEAKLFLMEQYYDQMTNDYQFFHQFCKKKEDELNDCTFNQVIEKLIGVQRSVLEGTGDKQQLEFTEQYEYKVTGTSKTGIAAKDAVTAGLCIGACGGALAGAALGEGPGAIVGAIGGCILGAAIGGLCHLLNPPEYKVESTTHIGTVTEFAEEITYDGSKHADALLNITQKIQESEAYKKLYQELKSGQQTAQTQLQILTQRKADTIEIGEKVKNYRSEMKKLLNKFETGNTVSHHQANMIDKKVKNLSAEIKAIVATMK